MIAVISAVAIPTIARSGLFTSNKAALAAREVFTLLRAAKVYATTHNVPTVVAYVGRNDLSDETRPDELYPIVDGLVLARQLTRDEYHARNNPNLVENTLSSAGFTDADNPPYVPLRGIEGIFRELPNDTAILPELFQVNGSGATVKGVVGIFIWDDDEQIVLEPRDNYRGIPNAFPAHRFLPEGSMDVPDDHPQRFSFRIGMLPTQDIDSRFWMDPADSQERMVFIKFTQDDAAAPLEYPILEFNEPDDGNNDPVPIEIDATIELFVPTGRVKILD